MRWSGWVVVLAALLAAGSWVGAVEVTEDRSDDITLPSAGEEFHVAAGGNYTFSGTIIGNGALIKTGPGELYLSPSGSNSYTGGTVVLGGTLRLDDPLSISPDSMIIVRGDGSAGSAVIRSDDFVMVGDSGSGTLDISDGGAVDSTNFVVGNGLGSRGVARVAGDGSALTASDYLSVGSDGTGYLSVVQGGLVQAGTNINIGQTSGGGARSASMETARSWKPAPICRLGSRGTAGWNYTTMPPHRRSAISTLVGGRPAERWWLGPRPA